MVPCRARVEDEYIHVGLVAVLGCDFFFWTPAHCFFNHSSSNALTVAVLRNKMREIVALAFAAGAAASPFDKNKWHFAKKPHGWYVQESQLLQKFALDIQCDLRGRRDLKAPASDFAMAKNTVNTTAQYTNHTA